MKILVDMSSAGCLKCVGNVREMLGARVEKEIVIGLCIFIVVEMSSAGCLKCVGNVREMLVPGWKRKL